MLKVKTEKPEDSLKNLINQLEKFINLLDNLKESEAAQELREVLQGLRKSPVGKALPYLERIIEAFEGDHELIAYTFRSKRSEGEWTDAEELYIVSTRVLNLTRRTLKSLS